MSQRLRQHWTAATLGLTREQPVRVHRFVHRTGPPRHDHDFWEIVLIVGGRARQYTGAGEAALTPGQTLVIRPGAYHDYHNCVDLDLINCYVLPALFDKDLLWLRDDPAVNRLLQPPPTDPMSPWTLSLGAARYRRCRVLLEPVVSDGRKPPPAGKAGMVGSLLALIEELATAGTQQHGPAPPAPPAVRRGALLLEQETAQPWCMDELAARLHVSKAHFSRQFKAAMGLPPMAYLARLRAERAAALLRRTDLTVAEIGARVGYPRPDYFIPRFRKIFGVSPGVYRKNETLAAERPKAASRL